MKCVTVDTSGHIVEDTAEPCQFVLITPSEYIAEPDALGITPESVLLVWTWGFGAVLLMWSLGFAVNAAKRVIAKF